MAVSTIGTIFNTFIDAVTHPIEIFTHPVKFVSEEVDKTDVINDHIPVWNEEYYLTPKGRIEFDKLLKNWEKDGSYEKHLRGEDYHNFEWKQFFDFNKKLHDPKYYDQGTQKTNFWEFYKANRSYVDRFEGLMGKEYRPKHDKDTDFDGFMTYQFEKEYVAGLDVLRMRARMSDKIKNDNPLFWDGWAGDLAKALSDNLIDNLKDAFSLLWDDIIGNISWEKLAPYGLIVFAVFIAFKTFDQVLNNLISKVI